MSRIDGPGRDGRAAEGSRERVTFESLEATLRKESGESGHSERRQSDEIQRLGELWQDIEQLQTSTRDRTTKARASSRDDALVDLLERVLEAERTQTKSGDVVAVVPDAAAASGRHDPSSPVGGVSAVWRLAAALLAGLSVGILVARLWIPAQPTMSDGAVDLAAMASEGSQQSLQALLTLALDDGSTASARLTAIDAAHELARPTETVTAALVRVATRDRSVGVRLAAIDALDRFLARSAITRELAGSLAGSLPLQTSPLVQLSALSLLDELSGAELVDDGPALDALDTLLQQSGLPPEVQVLATDLRTAIASAGASGRGPGAGDRL